MGFNSWLTSDTNRSIPNVYSNKEQFKVHMMDKEGNIWIEDTYEGYGDLGGKNYFELLAEMNGGKTKEDGLTIYNGVYGIKNVKTSELLLYDKDFLCWDTPIYEGQPSPYSLLYSGDWVRVSQKLVDIDYPLLLEIPEAAKEWYNKSPIECEYQGYFYDYEMSEEERFYEKR
jgi:hypothetical protein